MPAATFCRDCGAHLLFVQLVSGKRIPVDRAPDTGTGNVCALQAGAGWNGYVVSADRPARTDNGWRRFMPHAATCRRTAPKNATPPTPTLF